MMRRSGHRQRGAATIEFAFVAVLAVLVMEFCWWAGRAYWQYHVLEAATRDAARLIASTPPGEMASSSAFYAVRAQAEALIQEAADSNGINFDTSGILCDGSVLCSAAGLKVIRMESRATLPETVFSQFGGDGVEVVVAVEVPYDGRFAFQ